MTLRIRLALTAVLLLIPTMVGSSWLQHAARRRAFEESMSQYAHSRMDQHERAACEASPEAWMPPEEQRRLDRGPAHERPDHGPPSVFGIFKPQGPGGHHGPDDHRRIQLFAYDTNIQTTRTDAPPIAEALRQKIIAGASVASIEGRGDGHHSSLDVLVRMPWRSGPCAFVLARSEIPGPGLMPPFDLWAIPAIATLAALLLSVGPVIRRVRKLTQEVSYAGQHQYDATITQTGSDEITKLAQAFDTARTRIRADLAERERREKALRAFLENTTHDVMIPLTVLLGHLSQVREDVSSGNNVAPDTVENAVHEAHYITALLRNLSTVAKLEAVEARVQLTAVNMNELVERCIARHLPIARQKSVALESSVPEATVTVQADVTLVEQAVSNAVYNAVRYTPSGGHVAVVLSGPTRTRQFHLRVMDDGPGIPDDELARIVERGVRGNEARTRAPEGQGLGLSIAQEVMKLHGWRMTLSRSEFGGLLVEFESPAA